MSCPYCMRDEGHYLGCRNSASQARSGAWWPWLGLLVVIVLVLRLVGG
jgi:hypothetical protein